MPKPLAPGDRVGTHTITSRPRVERRAITRIVPVVVVDIIDVDGERHTVTVTELFRGDVNTNHSRACDDNRPMMDGHAARQHTNEST